MSDMEAPPTTRRSRSRTLFLVYPKFQLVLLAYSVAIAVIVTALCYGAATWFFHQSAQVEGFRENAALVDFLTKQREILGPIILGTGLLSIVLVSVASLWLSNRVAGPIRRLVGHMKEVVEGRTDQNITFRKQDFFPEVADAFNEVMDTVRETKRRSFEDVDLSKLRPDEPEKDA